MGLTATPLAVVALSFLAALLVEAASWLLVYRTAAYKRLVHELERQNKKLAALKAAPAAALKTGNKQRKEARMEDSVKATSKDLNGVRMRTNLIFSGVMFLAYQVLGKLFSGVVVAKLPFEAPSFLQRMTHAGLPGEDYTEAGATLLFLLGAMMFRQNLQKLLGWAPPRAAVQFPTAAAIDKFSK